MFPLIISFLATSASGVIALVADRSSNHRVGRGRPSPYALDGKPPQAPTGGWKSSSANSVHGRLLVDLIRRGEVVKADTPSQIWKKYELLRVVNPKDAFRKFVKSCRTKADDHQDQVIFNNSDADEMAPGADPSIFSSDSEDDSFIPSSARSSRMRAAPDAPFSGSRLTQCPLQTLEAMQTKDQQYHSPTRVYKTDGGYIISVAMLRGYSIENYDITRDDDEHNVIIVESPNPHDDENQVMATFCDGKQYAVGEERQLLNLSPADATMARMAKDTIKFNGGRADKRTQIEPKARMAIRLTENVKKHTSPWKAVDRNGDTIKIQGMFEAGDFMYFHFEKDNAEGTVRNRVKLTPPRPRAAPPQQPQPPGVGVPPPHWGGWGGGAG